jgi:hypothetical protein
LLFSERKYSVAKKIHTLVHAVPVQPGAELPAKLSSFCAAES